MHGATAQALGAATHEIFTYDEEGNLLTPNFYDYHVPHALDMPPMKNGFIESESPFTPLGAKGMGEGGGAGIHAVCAALQNALGRRGEGPIVWRSCNPYEGVWEPDAEPGGDAQARRGGEPMKVSGERQFEAPRETVWEVLNDPAQMAKTMPGVESFDIQDDRHWRAHVKIPLGLGGLRMSIDFEKLEEREPEFAKLHAKGNGVGAMLNMETSFNLSEAGDGTNMKWEADVQLPAPSRSMGQRVLQPIVNQQVSQVLGALDKQVQEAKAG